MRSNEPPHPIIRLSHRHAPAALRSCSTVVDGQREETTPGDVVLTPSGCWHGHANDGDAPAFWLDFLDVPFVRHIGATSFEHYPEPFQRPVERDPTYRIPLGTVLGERSDMHSVEIAKDVMPTIGLHVIRLPAGIATAMLNESANNLYAVVSGAVRVVVEGQLDEHFGRGDVLAVPSWHAHALHGVEDATLLRVTDEPGTTSTKMMRLDKRQNWLRYSGPSKQPRIGSVRGAIDEPFWRSIQEVGAQSYRNRLRRCVVNQRGRY